MRNKFSGLLLKRIGTVATTRYMHFRVLPRPFLKDPQLTFRVLKMSSTQEDTCTVGLLGIFS